MTCSLCDMVSRLESVPGEEIVWQTRSSVAFLGLWQYYIGYCVLVARKHCDELHRLPDAERREYLDDLCTLGRAIEAAFRPRKLNYELLGNQVSHLHWHVIPRYDSDPNHLQAAWVDVARAEADPALRQRLMVGSLSRPETAQRIRQQLAGTGP